MTKEEAVIEFIKGLRIAINSATAYFKEHPGFKKAVESFKVRIDALLPFMNPIKIYFSADSLYMDGKYFKNLPMYIEVATAFHLRKIKSIEILDGATLEELIEVLAALSTPRREILKLGGVNKILGKKISHIWIEELDYSQALKERKEGIDVWYATCKKALETRDKPQIATCADSLGMVIGKVDLKDLLIDKQLKEVIYELLIYLKENEKERFENCAKDLFNNFAKYKNTLDEDQIAELSSFFKHLNEDDFAFLLSQELLTDNNFDALSLSLFARIAGKGKEKDISSELLNKIISKGSLRNNPEVIKKIDGLLKASGDADVPEIYRHTLISLLKDISFDKKIVFDRSLLEVNYRFILLSLMEAEENEKRLAPIVERAASHIEIAGKEKDFSYLKALLEVSKIQRSKKPAEAALFDKIDKQVLTIVQDLIWEEQVPAEMEYLIKNIKGLEQDAEFYLEKIFVYQKITPYSLELFFKFFPSQRGLFEQEFKERHADTELLVKIVQSIKQMDPALSLDLLKDLYSFASEYAKIEILNAMKDLPRIDEAFLFSILEKSDLSLKKAVLTILADKKETHEKALAILFGIPNFMGFKNSVIMDDLIAIEESRFRAAIGTLTALTKKRYLWNISLRKKAQEILRSWNAGEN